MPGRTFWRTLRLLFCLFLYFAGGGILSRDTNFMDTLSILFGTALRVKMIRLFLFNPVTPFDFEQIAQKMSVKPKELKDEIAFSKKLGLIKQVKISKIVTIKKGKKVITKKAKVSAWVLDPKFTYTDALTDFLVKTHSVENREIVKKLERAGKLKMVLVSGIFTRNAEARLDMFVVADNIKGASMDRIVKSIESDMGKDIRYAVLSAPDFAYRKSMNDKLVRDVLDFPHRVLVDRIGISVQQ